MFSPTFLPFLLATMRVFLLGMGIVNPLGTAQALSPFGEKAGAASALLGFWQMMAAAIGVWLAATISHQAMFALGARADGRLAARARPIRDAGTGGLTLLARILLQVLVCRRRICAVEQGVRATHSRFHDRRNVICKKGLE